jgi:fumarylacetoacetase-like protein
MFHPIEQPMERGWVGRVDGDHVVQLAAQTLESFFTGGGTAREHAVYRLDGVRLLTPVLHPPSIRVFEDASSFSFANPAAVTGPDAAIRADGSLSLIPRTAAVVGLEGALGGFTVFGEWRRPEVPAPKDRDFALALGPVVVTPDAMEADGSLRVRVDGEARLDTGLGSFDWSGARDLASEGTRLRPGDLIAGPAAGTVGALTVGSEVEIEVGSIGTLRQIVR